MELIDRRNEDFTSDPVSAPVRAHAPIVHPGRSFSNKADGRVNGSLEHLVGFQFPMRVVSGLSALADVQLHHKDREGVVHPFLSDGSHHEQFDFVSR